MARIAKMLAAVAAMFAMQIGLASADEVADFYRGKTVSLVVGHEVGTGFDIYARLLARYLGKYVPGNPAVVVQTMQGASGMTAGNWLYNAAPRDGTVMATFAHNVTFEPLIGDGKAKYEPMKFTWVGNMDESNPICGVSPAAGIGGFDELFKKEVLFGGSGAGTAGPLSQSSVAVRNLTGAKIKLIQGYRGSHDIKLAIERGEVHGICGLPLTTVRTDWRDLADSGRFKVILQLGRNKVSNLGAIPDVYDYAKTDEDRQVFDLIFGVQSLGRSYAGPPGVPPARVATLRKSFLEALDDPGLIAEAKAAGMNLTPMNGEAVEKLIAGFYGSSPAVIARAKAAVRGN